MKTIQEKMERMDLTMARRPKGNSVLGRISVGINHFRLVWLINVFNWPHSRLKKVEKAFA